MTLGGSISALADLSMAPLIIHIFAHEENLPAGGRPRHAATMLLVSPIDRFQVAEWSSSMSRLGR